MLLHMHPDWETIVEELDRAGIVGRLVGRVDGTRFVNVRRLRAGMSMERNTLYVTDDGCVTPGGARLRCPGTAPDALLDTLMLIFQRFQAQERLLDELVYQSVGLRELCEAGAALLDNPICIHDDWSGNSTRRGQKVQVNENTVDRIHVYNPRKEVVQAQIIEAGGIEHYKGQVLYIGLHGKGYPTPIYDACVTDISTDEGLGNVKYRNARNNFLVSCMLIAKKGQPKIDPDGRIEQEQMISDDDLKQFQGDERTGKILYVELENDEDRPEVVEFPARNFDKDFSVTESSIVERIYAQFHQEIFHAVRIGKLGFSGDVMREAYEYYAGEVTHEQRFIERVFAKVFADWHEPLPTYDFSIAPLRYVNSETTNTTTDGGQGNG